MRDCPKSAAVSIESLETRRLLAADPADLLAGGFVPVEWQGQTVYARPDQWVAKLDGLKGNAGKQVQAVNAALGRAAVAGLKAVKHLGQDGLVLLESGKGKKLGDVKSALRAAKDLQPTLVEPDFALWSEATAANDTYYGSYQYGLNNTGQTGGTPDADVDAPEAWDITTGNGSVVVSVIDSGIDHSHPDLSANMWRNPGEIAGNGIDDDRNGYTDDVYGWDFYNNDANPMDDGGHGTHVAGTIAASGNNRTGVAGAAWNAKLMALKFLGADGTGSLSSALAAINYATNMRSTYGINVRVTNNSWGGGGYSSTLHNAIAKSGQAGILFVAAAGNGGADGVGDDNDKYPSYPAGYNSDNVISVAASDHNDRLAGFSNYGATTVDLAAPGVNIASTYPGGGYVYMSGTSMATPLVSGVAALAWSYNPDASYHSVRGAVLKGVDLVSGLSGKTATGGRLNAHKTLLNIPAPLTAPAAPSGLAATASGTQISLAWIDNSGNENGFKIERSTDGGASFTQIATVGAGVTVYGDAGRASSTTYAYRVRANNAAGDSTYSNTATATTADTVAPSAPTGLSITKTTNSSVSLTWTASTDAAGVSGYQVFRNSVLLTTIAQTSFTDTGLTAATHYGYTVRAYDAAGNVSGDSNLVTALTPVSASATFVKSDVATQGTWKGTYGTDGYVLAGDATSLPSYARLAVNGHKSWTWAETTTDVRALQKGASTAREASTWYSDTSFTIDLNLTDGRTHQVGLYALDWDRNGRVQSVEVTDAVTGQVLDTRTMSEFQNGQHLVWTLSGHVQIRVNRVGGHNAVVSGLFFDAEALVTSATLLESDAATQGTWKGTYGADGYTLAGDGTSLPSYAQVAVNGHKSWTWAETTTDVRALQKGASTGREASTWYSDASFTIDLNLTDGRLHQVGLYAVDWDRNGRVQSVEVIDAVSRQVLDTRTMSEFQNGQHLVWNLSGHVQIRVTRVGGHNAVVSGLFFDQPSTAAAAYASELDAKTPLAALGDTSPFSSTPIRPLGGATRGWSDADSDPAAASDEPPLELFLA